MPAFCTVNGLNVLDGSIYIPRVGVWHADLSIDSFQQVSGAATIQLASQTLKGTFTRNGTDVSKRLRARVVGGAAGMATQLGPRSYGSIQVRIPLTDALNGAGETLSATADSTVLGTQLLAWSRMQAPASAVLAMLLQAVLNAPTWRVLLDGTVWVGYESWPSSSLPDTVPISAEPEKGRITIASDAPAVLPGTAFSYVSPGVGQLTKNISFVQHLIRPDETRTLLFYE